MSEVTAFKYRLGLQAKDPISGVEGIILCRVHHLFGCGQYGLAQKKLADGTVPKTEFFDEARLEITGDGVKTDGPQIMEFEKIFVHAAGKEARDKVTGFKGKIVYRMEYLHAANTYALTPGVDSDGKLKEMEQFDEGRIEIIGEGIPPKDVEAPKRGGIVNRDAPRFR